MNWIEFSGAGPYGSYDHLGVFDAISSACVVYTETFNHLGVVESSGYLPPPQWIIVKYIYIHLHVDFISVQNDFCRPCFLRAAKIFWARFITEAFLDHIRYSRYMNWLSLCPVSQWNYNTRCSVFSKYIHTNVNDPRSF